MEGWGGIGWGAYYGLVVLQLLLNPLQCRHHSVVTLLAAR